jgi:MoxR-like ATPase
MSAVNVDDLRRIVEQFRRATSDFVSHGQVFELRNHRRRVSFELPDLVLAGLLAGENILLVGSSGTGKTFLAQRALRGLFGDAGFGVLNVTPGLDEDVLFDVDLAVQLKGGRLAESIHPGPLMTGYGLVIDDMYRAHPKLRNVLLALVRAEPAERRLSGKGGAPIPVGRAYPDGSGLRWYSVIATANPPRAGEYAGNYEADHAETRRFALVIDVDKYAPKAAQMRRLLKTTHAAAPAVGPAVDGDAVVRLHQAVTRIPVSFGAQLLAMLAAAHNRCEKTADGVKPWARLPDYCSSEKVKCAVARNDGTVCPYVGELPPAAVQDLIDVGRAVAALEWAAAVSAGEDPGAGPEVKLSHGRALFPFVARDKVWLHRRFYEDPDRFNGDQEAALRRVVEAMCQDVTDFQYQHQQVIAGLAGAASASAAAPGAGGASATPNGGPVSDIPAPPPGPAGLDAAAAGAAGNVPAGVRLVLQRWARSRSPALADVWFSLLGIEPTDEARGNSRDQ